MNILSELNRFSFVWKRDGEVKASSWAKQTLSVYVAAARNRRLHQGKSDVYRRKFVVAAVSLRWLLRHVKGNA